MLGPSARTRTRSARGAYAALVVVTLLAAGTARAQQAGPQETRARGLLREAVEAYQNLDLDVATGRLREALRRCGSRGCSPRTVAELNVTLGVVELGGRNNAAAAGQAFTAALQADPSVQIDPMLATPEITAAFSRARRALRGVPSARLLHTPVVEQLDHTPIPVYVETGITGAIRVELSYRAVGGTSWTAVPMQRVARGWGAEIPCAAVTPPGVEYYVTAFDERDQPSAEAASEEAPQRVAVVTSRTRPAPSMPGQLPPQRCRQPGDRRLAGDACEQASDCAAGLSCERGVCAAPRAETGHATVAGELGAGVGLGLILGTPGYAEATADPANPMGPAMCRTVSCPVDASGIAPTVYLWLVARYHVTPRVAIGGAVRWQPDAAPRTTLSSLLLSLRGYYVLTPGGFARTGLVGAVFGGIGGGQIQPRAPSPSAERPNAETGHIVTGLWNLHAGGRVEYGFAPGIHVGAEATLQLMFFRPLLDLDLQAVAGMHF
jgi:hypothetical protein